MAPSSLKIIYANVQTWTEDKKSSLAAYLTMNNPDIILMADIGKANQNKPIKLFQYLVFATNKSNENSAGSALAIKKGLQFKILNNFDNDTIGVQVHTQTGLL